MSDVKKSFHYKVGGFIIISFIIGLIITTASMIGSTLYLKGINQKMDAMIEEVEDIRKEVENIKDEAEELNEEF